MPSTGSVPSPPPRPPPRPSSASSGGDVEKAVHEVIENHVRYAGGQGFATNIGGLVTAAVTIPANVAGLALVQSRMVAGIAHLRGYELADPRVRNAILACLLGEDAVRSLVKQQEAARPADGHGDRSRRTTRTWTRWSPPRSPRS